jgi:hypothetical protein
MTVSPSRQEALSRLGSQTANELGASSRSFHIRTGAWARARLSKEGYEDALFLRNRRVERSFAPLPIEASGARGVPCSRPTCLCARSIRSSFDNATNEERGLAHWTLLINPVLRSFFRRLQHLVLRASDRQALRGLVSSRPPHRSGPGLLPASPLKRGFL